MRRFTSCLLTGALLLGVTSGATKQIHSDTTERVSSGQKASRNAKNKASKPYQVGKASWYGRPFHGRSTANGERYNMYQLTAAHRQLPMGTWVKVTNLRTGRSVLVRVNDRGPVPESRIIDLSFEAAHLIGLNERGVEKVRLDLVGPETVAESLNFSGSM